MLRVTQGIYYRQTSKDLVKLQADQYLVRQKISTGKAVITPSDDPISSLKAQYTNRQLDEATQYTKTVDHVRTWLNQSNAQMSSILDQLTTVQGLAEQMATGTYDADQRENASSQATNILEQLVTLCNAEVNGRYIFSGTRETQAAVNATLTADNPAVADSANTGNGSFYGQGTYTGRLSRNITLTVDAAYAGGIPSAANPMEVNVSYVDDYGRSITHQVTLTGGGSSNPVDIGDGIELFCDELSYTAGDSFTLTVGRNRGNEEDISSNLSWDNRMVYNYTMDELFRSEGYTGGKFQNVLDLICDWKDYLNWDDQDQSAYGAIPATWNNPSSTAQLDISGDWNELNRAGLEFHVGSAVQSLSDDADLSNYRNFQLDAGYAGGAPSAANPMTLNYEYWNGATWTNQSVNITGTGQENSFTLVGGVDIFMVNSDFSASDGPFDLTPVYSEDTEPSVANPLTMTYTYGMENGVRQYATVTFTGTGSANSQTIDPPGDMTLTLASGSTFDDADSWTFSMEQYNQGQTKSQELLDELDDVTSNLLKYMADNGAKINRMDVREQLLGDDALRMNDRLAVYEDADIVTLNEDLSILETMYEAALQATALVSAVTLADYL